MDIRRDNWGSFLMMKSTHSWRFSILFLANFVLLIAVIYFVSARIILKGFDKVEEENAITNGLRLQSALDNELVTLDTTAISWAQWEQARKFVLHTDPIYNKNFIANECNLAALTPTMASAVAYVTLDGTILFAQGFDWQQETVQPFPAELRKELRAGGKLLQVTSADDYVRGILHAKNGVMLVASRGVTYSNGTGKVAGIFVLARFFDDSLLQQMTNQVRLPIEVQELDKNVPSDFAFAEKTLPKGSRESLRVPLDEKVNAVYLRLYDLHNRPVMLARLNAPRYVYQQAINSLRALLLALLTIGAVFGAVLLVTQNSLEHSRRERRKSDDLYRSLALNSSDILFSLDFPSEEMLWFGDSKAFFGTISPAEHNLAAWLERVHPNDRAACETLLRNADEHGFEGEFRMLHDTLTVYVLLRGKKLTQENGVTRLVAAATDITTRKQSEMEKEVLLKEIHHRVKNNMQVISSMLNLQASRLTDEPMRATFQDSQNRIKSMALIHERLYGQNDLAQVDFAGYLEQLTRNLVRSYRLSAVELKLDLQKVQIDIDRAVPCGLIVNELVSNALKHAFSKQGGTLKVQLQYESNDMVKLSIEDDGIGFPEDMDYRNSDSLGLQLVEDFSTQISGTISLERLQPGTRWSIAFPASSITSGT